MTRAALFSRLGLVAIASLQFFGASAGIACAADRASGEVQPYIDKVKEKYGIESRSWKASTGTPTEKETAEAASVPRAQVPGDSQSTQPYIESLKRQHGIETRAADSPASGGVQPYIESIKAGRELKPKMKEKVDQAAGINVMVRDNFNVAGGSGQANPFNRVYNTEGRYNPAFNLFYEKQFLRSRALGALGVVGHLGFITAKGKGVFTNTGARSDDTNFRFTAVPITAGLSYRLVQLRFLVPFVQVSGALIPFLETRDDGEKTRKAMSRGYTLVGGAALNLDWIGRRNAWQRYDDHGILHTYLVARVESLKTLSGDLNFNHTGTYVGLMFEF
ncbi:MAG: hypothetical protein AB1540_11115 [Bdellovibrionota bacterium]